MPTGWFVVQPPSSGTQTTTLRKVAVALAGSQPVDGSIAPIALDRVAVAMSGQMLPEGPMNVALKKLAFSLVGEENTLGGLAVTLPKVSYDFEQDLFTGALFSTLQPVKLAFALQTQGEIATHATAVSVAMAGLEEYTGALGARLAVAQHILAGAHQQDGVLATTLKKATANLIGPIEAKASDSTGGGLSATRTLSTRTLTAALPLQENDVIVHWANLTSGGTPAVTDPVGWVNLFGPNGILFNAEHSMVGFYHLVTAAEVAANTTSWTMTNVLSITNNGRQVTHVLRGVDPSAPIDVVATRPDGPMNVGGLQFPDITPTKSGSFIMGISGPDDLNRTLTSATDPWMDLIKISAGSTTNIIAIQHKSPTSAGVTVTGPLLAGGILTDSFITALIAFAVKPQ